MIMIDPTHHFLFVSGPPLRESTQSKNKASRHSCTVQQKQDDGQNTTKEYNCRARKKKSSKNKSEKNEMKWRQTHLKIVKKQLKVCYPSFKVGNIASRQTFLTSFNNPQKQYNASCN